MITVDYLRGERDQVSQINPAMRQSMTAPTPLVGSHVVQWSLVITRRATIALKSLSSQDQKTVNELINGLKKKPFRDFIAEESVGRVDSERFSVVYKRWGNVIEISDILNRRIVSEFDYALKSK